ncbi:MAG: MarR family transcriptional regulator [Gammaproteobacteria bacterium]|nr:MarR family transcriptional regulator [Gammaproteobacteria bacterium]
MSNRSETGAAIAAEIILHLARLAHGEGHACGLTSAQWAALRYFARANRSSRTLLAFADYHVTTRGTASQTVTNLVNKGLLTRKPSQQDGRSSTIDLTAKGRSLCEDDPVEELARAIAKLRPDFLKGLLASLDNVLERIVVDGNRRLFGTCPSCSHIIECASQDGRGRGHICHRTGLPLRSSEIDQLCVFYEPDKK